MSHEQESGWKVRPPKDTLIKIPSRLWGNIREIANQYHTTDMDVVKRILLTGLAIIKGIEKGDEFFVRSNSIERKIVIFDDPPRDISSD